ncbi:MAG: hypothetical protein AABZ30_07930, partial [Myxococcota bacterium]
MLVWLSAAVSAAPAEPSARDCGRCHARHFEEWSRSAHARAGKTPLYEWQSLLFYASLEASLE